MDKTLCTRCMKEIKESEPTYLQYNEKTFQWSYATKNDNNVSPFGKHCAREAIKENELRRNWKFLGK